MKFKSDGKYHIPGRGDVYATVLGFWCDSGWEVDKVLNGEIVTVEHEGETIKGRVAGVEKFAHGKMFSPEEKIGLLLRDIEKV